MIDYGASTHYLGIWERMKCIVLGLNRVAVGRYGPILKHNGATGSRKLSGYLPDLQDTI